MLRCSEFLLRAMTDREHRNRSLYTVYFGNISGWQCLAYSISLARASKLDAISLRRATSLTTAFGSSNSSTMRSLSSRPQRRRRSVPILMSTRSRGRAFKPILCALVHVRCPRSEHHLCTSAAARRIAHSWRWLAYGYDNPLADWLWTFSLRHGPCLGHRFKADCEAKAGSGRSGMIVSLAFRYRLELL